MSDGAGSEGAGSGPEAGGPTARDADDGDENAGSGPDEPSGSYAAVHARPDGGGTVARHALTAATYGFDGIVVRNHGDAPADYDPAAIRDRYGVDVVRGVEVRAEEPSRAGGYVGNHRPEATVLAVHGGTAAIDRFAVEQPAVDVLAHPAAGEFDDALAKAAARNGVHVEVNLRSALREDGGTRVRALRDLRRLVRVLDHYDAPFVVSGDPRSHLELRAPRELVAVAGLVGLDPPAARAGLAAWGEIARRNRDRGSDAFVEPGVRIVDDEDA